MKVTLDIDKLLREGRITSAEYARLQSFAAADTGSLALNILLGFGVIATAAGTLALLHSAPASIVLGALLVFGGITLANQAPRVWGVLSSILLLVGALLTGGGILFLTDGAASGFIAVTVLLLLVGITTRSGLLVGLGTLALSPTVGAATAYGHATYWLIIERPAVTVLLFSLLCWAAYQASLKLEPELQRLALISARCSMFLVNFGFWVGSLWGDSLGRAETRWQMGHAQAVPDWVFALGWAVALLATGVWAARENRRWVVNLVAVFGAIHLYTQYFERLGASPGSIVAAGLGAIGIALALVRYNKNDSIQRPPSPAPAR
jgi:iron complex transport system permease protein